MNGRNKTTVFTEVVGVLSFLGRVREAAVCKTEADNAVEILVQLSIDCEKTVGWDFGGSETIP